MPSAHARPVIPEAPCLAEPAMSHHRLTVDRTLGALLLRADLALTAPWTLLFGPSGSGKTSLLRAACGLLGHEGIHFSRFEPDGKEVLLLTPQHALPTYRL